MVTSSNPFSPGGPVVDPESFIGGQRLLESMVGELAKAQAQCLAFIAPRRMGTTSYLRQLLRRKNDISRLANLNCELIYVDCTLFSNVTAGQIFAFLEQALNAVMDSANVSAPMLGVDEGHLFDRTAHVSLKKRLGELIAMETRAIFLLDRFDVLATNSNCDRLLLNNLSALSDNYGTAYVIAASQPLAELKYCDASLKISPWWRKFNSVSPDFLSEDQCRELFIRLCRRAKVDSLLDPNLLNFLVALAGPHPMLLQIAGWHAYSITMTRQSENTDITELFDDIGRSFLVDAEPMFSSYWGALDDMSKRSLAMLALARNRGHATLKELLNSGLVKPEGAEISYLSSAARNFVGRKLDVDGICQLPPIVLDTKNFKALLRDQPLPLTPAEFALLQRLINGQGDLVPFATIFDDPKAISEKSTSSRRTSLRKFVNHLTDKLGTDADCIKSVAGYGYCFVPKEY